MEPARARNEVRGWWRAGRATLGNLFRLFFRLRFYGLERLPRSGPALVACNHISVLDPIALGIGATERGRIVRFLAAAETFRQPVVGWGLRAFRQIPIERGASDRKALEAAAAVIREGGLAGIFPEGRVVEGPDLGPPRKGAARLALTAGVPLVPMAIWGPQVRWPRRGLRFGRPWRPDVAVVVGDPIPVEGDTQDPWAVRALTERLMAAIGELLEEAKRRAPNRV